MNFIIIIIIFFFWKNWSGPWHLIVAIAICSIEDGDSYLWSFYNMEFSLSLCVFA